jgi:DNA-directed RNA polymerase specialized sigma24 family protein/tetratricopeptide (TPR) repeat protein
MYPETQTFSSDLDWMMQSPQISDGQLIQVLTQEYYARIYRLAISITGDVDKARQAVEQTIIDAVSNRRRFWGNPTLKAWLMELAIRRCRDPGESKSLFSRLRSLRPGASQWPAVPPVQAGSLPLEHHGLGSALQDVQPQGLLLLSLRYVHGLTASEIAYVLKTGEGSLLSRLREIRTKVQAQENRPAGGVGSVTALSWTDEHCRAFHLLMHTALDGSLDDEKQARLKQHMIECPQCRVYSSELVEFDHRLGRCIGSCWPASEAPKANPEAISVGIGENVGKTRQQRRVSRLVKEVSVVVAAILVVFALSSIGNLDADEAVPTPPPANPMSAAEVESLSAGPEADAPAPSRQNRRRSGSGFAGLPSYLDRYPAGSGTSKYLEFQSLKEHWSPARQMPDLNMSGSVNLQLLLYYWSERGNPIPYLQPNHRDETVMFYEMLNYIEDHTGLEAMTRMGGDLETLRELIGAGIPVMVQKGFDGPGSDGWAGHYVIVNGYSDDSESVVLLAAYPEDGGDVPMAYGEFEENWRAFNYSFLIVYPSEKAEAVSKILGEQADPFKNYRYAAEKAAEEVAALDAGRDLFFAWFNQGTSLTYLEDHTEAKEAFDEAFAIYSSLPAEERPWRILWYQTRPYWAYFYTGNYQDVIELATSTLESIDDPILEESYYWRALAKEALGDLEGAIQDLNEAIRLNPNFIAGKYQLRRIKGES